MGDYLDIMAFNGLPALFDDKVQNTELFVQKRIYETLPLLSFLPVNQNPTGLFTNYINGNVELGDPEYSNNNITFNEIKFGQGQTVGGQTLPIGFKYAANTRDEQRGKYESSLMSFFNSAVAKIADFYEEQFMTGMVNGARASSNTPDFSTASDIIDTELTLDDEMRYDSQGNATGYAPSIALVSRATKLDVDKALRKEDYVSNFQYIASNKLTDNDLILFDGNNPALTVEKYADPNYSVIQSLEDDGISIAEPGAIPQAFINLKSEDTGRPQTIDYYIWAEANINILDSNGILKATFS